MYQGTAPRALSDLIRARGRVPLEDYLRRADALFWGAWALAVVVVGLFLLNLRWGWLRVGPLARPQIIAASGVALFGVVPWPDAKVAVAVLTAIYVARRPLTLDRYQAGVIAFTVFALAFIVAPYWSVFTAPWTRGVALVCLLGLAGGWARLVASPVRVWAGQARALPLLTLALVLWAVNSRALSRGLPLAGDEAYHVTSVLILGWQPAWMAAGLLAALILMDPRRGRTGIAMRLGLLTAVCLVAGLAYRHMMPAGALLRYPLANRWIELVPVQALLPFGTLGWQEALFRLPSLLAVIGLAWVVYASRRQGSTVARVLTAVAVATTPALLYYASLLYLEPPAVVLMTLCCLDSERLLRADRAALWAAPSGWALLLVGFIKETTLPFLVAFCVCRLAVRLHEHRTIQRLRDEAAVAAAVLVPVASYLVLRILGGTHRSHGGDLDNLVTLRLYGTLLHSWTDQFGALCILAGIGAALVAWRRQWLTLSFFGLVLGTTAAFFITDSTEWLGYSRFNLHFVPVAIALAIAAVDFVTRRNRMVAAALVVAWLVANAALSPVHADGSKSAFRHDTTGEQYYPYRATMAWVSQTHPGERVLFAGFRWRYAVQFYFVKLGWYPPFEMLIWDPAQGSQADFLTQALKRGREGDFGVVVYQVLDGESVSGDTKAPGFVLAKTFANAVHRLAVYVREPSTPREPGTSVSVGILESTHPPR